MRLLERMPPGRWLIFRGARKDVLKRTHGNYPAPLAAIDVMQLGTDRGDERLRHPEVRPVPEAPHGVDVRMLEQQQVVVVVATGDPPLVEGALEIPRLLVRESTEPPDSERAHDSSCSQSHVSMASLIRRRNRTAVEPSNAR